MQLEVPLTPIVEVGHNSSIKRTVLSDLKNRLKRSFEKVELEQDGLHFQVVPFEDYLLFLQHTALEWVNHCACWAGSQLAVYKLYLLEYVELKQV